MRVWSMGARILRKWTYTDCRPDARASDVWTLPVRRAETMKKLVYQQGSQSPRPHHYLKNTEAAPRNKDAALRRIVLPPS